MKICVLPGDGIGPEITTEAVRVLKALDLKFEMEEALLGGGAVDATGTPYPEATQKLAREADAILLGAVGGPQWDSLPREKRPERGLLGIRKDLNLFANLRPAILYPELANASTLKPEVVAGLDILIVRELTGDIYFGQPRGVREENGERVGFNTMVYSESEIRRIGHVAFQAAQKRNKKLCSVDKMNVLECTQLWRDIAIEVSKDFPEVADCHPGTINLELECPLEVTQPDHRTAPLAWTPSGRTTEVFDLLRIELEFGPLPTRVPAWLYVAHASPHRGTPTVHEVITQQLNLSGQ